MAQLPSVFVDLLRRSAAKRRRMVALRGAAEAGTVLVLGLATAIAIDVVFKPGESMRLVNSLGVGVLAAGIMTVRVVRPLLHRPDEVSEARAIEADVRRAGVAGGDDDLLSSAVALSCQPTTGGTAGWMVERTMALAGTRAIELNPLRLIDGSATRKSLIICSSMVALALTTLVVPGMHQLWIRVMVPWSSTVRPGDLTFTISPGDVQIVQGNRLGIEVSISAAVERAEIELLWDDGATEIRPLHRDGSLWRLDLDALAVGASYRAVTGTNASPRFRIGLIHPPQVGELSLTVTPPAYTGRPVAMMPAAGAVILAGSKIDVAVTLEGEPVSSATLVRFPGGEEPMTMGAEAESKAAASATSAAGTSAAGTSAAGTSAAGTSAAGTSAAATKGAQAHASFIAPQPGSEGRLVLQLGIQLASAGTPAVDTQKRWALSIVADRPPTVSLSGQGATGGMVGRNEVIILEGKATDDEALRELFIEISAGDAPPLRRRLTIPAAGQSTINIPIDLADLGLTIGEGVVFRLVASDSGGQTAKSKPVNVVVADGDAAALSAMADALRSAARKLADAVGTLGRLESDIGNVASRVNAQSPVAERTAIAVARQRAESVIRQVNDIIAKLPRQAAAPIGPACGAVGDDAQLWCEQQGAILQNALLVMSGKDVALKEQAAFAAHEANAVLRTLAERLAVIAARAEAGRLEVRTAAAAPRVGRVAVLLSGQSGWEKPEANQPTQFMTSLPPAAMAHAQERFLADGAVLTGVLPSVTNMADLLDQRGQPLRTLAAQAKVPADELNALLQLPERDAKALQRSAVLAPVLGSIAVQAREELDRMLAERSSTRPLAIDALARAKQQAEELRVRADSWQRQPDPQDPTAAEAGTRELATAAAGVRQISVLLKDEQQRLLQRAQAPDATLAERRSALAERRMISSQVGPALVAANHALTEVAKEPEKLRDRRGDVVNSLAQLRDAIAQVDPAAEGQRGAPAANAARALLAAVPKKDTAIDAPEVAARAQALAAALRRQGDEARAKQVAEAAEASEAKRLSDLANEVLKAEEKDEQRQLNLSEDLKLLADAPKAESPKAEAVKADEARARLAGAALELHLAAEAARQDKQEAHAAAWDKLSHDLSAELARKEGPRPAALADLSVRSSALEGRQGDAARDHEIAQAKEATKNQAKNPEAAADQAAAQALEELNQRLDQAATAPDQRTAAIAALESYAEKIGLPPEVRAQTDKAQELTDLATQVASARQGLAQARADQQAAAQEAAAHRQRFAELERSIAQRLAAAGQAVATAAPNVSAAAPELTNTLNGIQPKIIERAASAEKLAAQVPATGADAGTDSATSAKGDKSLEPGATARAKDVAATREMATQAAALAQSAEARAQQQAATHNKAEEAALQRAQQAAAQVETARKNLKPDAPAASLARDATGELATAMAQQKLANRAADAAAAAEQLRALESADKLNESAIKNAASAAQTAADAAHQAAQEARQAAAVQSTAEQAADSSAAAVARARELTDQAAQAEQFAAQLKQAGSESLAHPLGAADEQATPDRAARVAALAATRDAAERMAQAASLAAESSAYRAAEQFAQLGQHGEGDQAALAAAARETQTALKESAALSQSADPAQAAQTVKAAQAVKAATLNQAAVAVARQATAEAEQARATAARATQEEQPAIANATVQLAREQADQAAAHAAAADALANASAALSAALPVPGAAAPGAAEKPPNAEQVAKQAAAEQAAAPLLADIAEETAQTTAAAAARAGEAAQQAKRHSEDLTRRAEDQAASPEARAAAKEQSLAAQQVSKTAGVGEERAKERAAQAKKSAQELAAAAATASAAAAKAAPASPAAAEASSAQAAQAAQAAQEAATDAATHADAGLAMASRSEAAAMREQLAQPVAQAWSAAALAKPGDAGIKQVGELGQEMARLAGEQEEAARLLEQSLKREESARQRLARQLAAGETARAAVDEAMDTAAAEPSSAAQSQIRASAAAAKQANTAAVQAWERASAASATATRAAQTATAIRQGALPGDQNAADQQAGAAAAQAIQAQNDAAGQAAQALAAERAALSAASAAQATNPADSATTRSSATGRLAALQTAAQQAADASRQQQAAAGPAADQAGAAAQQASTSAAAAREALLSTTDGMGTVAERLAAQLDNAAAAARQASAQRTAEASSAPPLAPVVAHALGTAAAALADTAVGRALAALAQAPDAEGSFRQASATMAAAANAARGAAALQNAGKAPAAAQTLAAATSAASKPGAPGAPGAPSKPGAPGPQQAQGAKPSASGTSEGGKPAAPENGPMPTDNAPPGIDQAEWAKLSERVQQAIRSGGSERFTEEHQEAIRAYYRKLGEEK